MGIFNWFRGTPSIPVNAVGSAEELQVLAASNPVVAGELADFTEKYKALLTDGRVREAKNKPRYRPIYSRATALPYVPRHFSRL